MELAIFEKHGQLYADSREVAEMVGKRHDHLLRDIGRYIKVLGESGDPKIGESSFFCESTYINEQNKNQPCYCITRQGCDLIAHKLTGDKGILFSASYINRFYEMERTILDRQSPAWQQARLEGKKARRMETDTIKAFVAYAIAAGSKSADKYYIHFSKLANKAVGITDRDTASTAKLLNLRVVEQIIELAVVKEMAANMEYHQAFQNVRDRVRQVAALAFLPERALMGLAS